MKYYGKWWKADNDANEIYYRTSLGNRIKPNIIIGAPVFRKIQSAAEIKWKQVEPGTGTGTGRRVVVAYIQIFLLQIIRLRFSRFLFYIVIRLFLQ